MRITGGFITLDYNIVSYKRQLDAYLTEFLKEGVQIWVTAVTGRVPIWSGMARAALLEITELVNGKLVLSPLKVKSRIPLGRALGEGKLTTDFPNYSFEVEIKVPHYVSQEVKNVGISPSAPWKSFEAGQEAFQEYIRGIQYPLPTINSKIAEVK